MFFSRLKKRKFRMVWRVEKDGRLSYLCGTAHFFPVSLKKDLGRLIEPVQEVLFEGPLDPKSMERIASYGREGESADSICLKIDPKVKKAINEQFKAQFFPAPSVGAGLQYVLPSSSDFIDVYCRGLRPWMVFFHLWSSFLNWRYSIDLEAFQVAQNLGKRIHFLETVEEQLAALDGIPSENIVEYINRFDHWKPYKDQFLGDFLDGNIEKLMSRTNRFPTRCESILGERDRRFFERAKVFFEKGSAIAFFGLSHIPTVRDMFVQAGFDVKQDQS
jgi:hypothetical protein